MSRDTPLAGDSTGSANSDVIETLLRRREAGSRPGVRDDTHRVALVIEGGGNRTAYSAGMALALDAAGLVDSVDAIYGTSGGALNAAWLLTGEAQRFLPGWAFEEVAAAGVNDPRRLLRGGPAVDLDVLVNEVYEHITPMDFAAILANPVTLHPIATDVESGAAVDLAPHITDRASLKLALKATTTLPLLAGRPVSLGDHRYLDGGLSEAVPFRSAIAAGATHVLVLRTRRAGQASSGSRLEQALMRPYFLRHARGAEASYRDRVRRYAADDAFLDAPPTGVGVAITQVRPPADSHDVPRLGRDLSVIAEALEIGRVAMDEVLAAQG